MLGAVIAENKKLGQDIKTLVSQAVFEILNDPDFGLSLSAKAKKRLTKIKIAGKKAITIPFSEIKKRYG